MTKFDNAPSDYVDRAGRFERVEFEIGERIKWEERNLLNFKMNVEKILKMRFVRIENRGCTSCKAR